MDEDSGIAGIGSISRRLTEGNKTLKLWVRRKSGNRKRICSRCGQRVGEIHEVYEREIRDLACFEFRTTVVIELYSVSRRTNEIGIRMALGGGRGTVIAMVVSETMRLGSPCRPGCDAARAALRRRADLEDTVGFLF